MALPKKNRLTTKKDINRVFKDGRTVKGSFLFIRFLESGKGYARFAFIVPTKHIPLAVDRNKIKRMLSGEVARTSALSASDYDAIIVISRKMIRDEFKKLVRELRDTLLKM